LGEFFLNNPENIFIWITKTTARILLQINHRPFDFIVLGIQPRVKSERLILNILPINRPYRPCNVLKFDAPVTAAVILWGGNSRQVIRRKKVTPT
jgi:hypothetical protein